MTSSMYSWSERDAEHIKEAIPKRDFKQSSVIIDGPKVSSKLAINSAFTHLNVAQLSYVRIVRIKKERRRRSL